MMATLNKNIQVDTYISKAMMWQGEMQILRQILLECGMSEALKWGKPCYSCAEGNVAIIQGFKKYFALLFFKGVLLKDPKQVLVKTGEHTHVGRQMRFTDISQILKMKSLIKAYVKEAVEIEKTGLKVAQQKAPLVFAEEFEVKLAKSAALKAAFNALTPGRQKGYHIYFTRPKQSSTRLARIEKCIPRILDGKGIND